MILGKIFSNISSGKIERKEQKTTANDLQKANNDLLKQSMNGLSSEALANISKGSFQAMQNLQDLNKQLQAQINKKEEK